MAALQVSGPQRIIGIHCTAYFNVSYDPNCRRREQPQPLAYAINSIIRRKHPVPCSFDVEIFLLYPFSTFHGVPTHSPSPQNSPNLRVYPCKASLRHNVAVIHCPTSDHRVEIQNQIRLCRCFVSIHDFSDLIHKRLHAFTGRGNKQFARILSDILAQKIETLCDMRDPSFLVREL